MLFKGKPVSENHKQIYIKISCFLASWEASLSALGSYLIILGASILLPHLDFKLFKDTSRQLQI